MLLSTYIITPNAQGARPGYQHRHTLGQRPISCLGRDRAQNLEPPFVQSGDRFGHAHKHDGRCGAGAEGLIIHLFFISVKREEKKRKKTQWHIVPTHPHRSVKPPASFDMDIKSIKHSPTRFYDWLCLLAPTPTAVISQPRSLS